MGKTMKTVSYLLVCVSLFLLSACGTNSKSEEPAAIYGETIDRLKDDELYAIIDTNAVSPVLLVTSQVFHDGVVNKAAIKCDVYYLVDKQVKNIGTIESLGTAYPISYDEKGIYTASGHSMQRYEIEKSGEMKLAEGVYEQFDENGNAVYTIEKGDKIEVITEEKYHTAFEKYGNAAVVGFDVGEK
ncbi:MAG: hypothetical protein J6N21_22945 [Butyrivibrio sp.]|nr:hypothetical protein [Butyrivibrio sp.]